MTEQEEYERIVANPPPTKGPFIERREMTVYGANGVEYSLTHSHLHSGVPELVTLKDDLHDSFWRYPEISVTMVAGPHDAPGFVNHAEYINARKQRGVGK